jgi:hypothetical protein
MKILLISLSIFLTVNIKLVAEQQKTKVVECKMAQENQDDLRTLTLIYYQKSIVNMLRISADTEVPFSIDVRIDGSKPEKVSIQAKHVGGEPQMYEGQSQQSVQNFTIEIHYDFWGMPTFYTKLRSSDDVWHGYECPILRDDFKQQKKEGE